MEQQNLSISDQESGKLSPWLLGHQFTSIALPFLTQKGADNQFIWSELESNYGPEQEYISIFAVEHEYIYLAGEVKLSPILQFRLVGLLIHQGPIIIYDWLGGGFGGGTYFRSEVSWYYCQVALINSPFTLYKWMICEWGVANFFLSPTLPKLNISGPPLWTPLGKKIPTSPTAYISACQSSCIFHFFPRFILVTIQIKI